MQHLILSIIAAMAILSGERKKVIAMMGNIGIHTRYYPKRYVKVSRFIRKVLRIEYKELPFFLYHELLMSIFFAVAFFAYPFLNNEKVALYFVLSFFVLYILELVYVFTCYGIFRRNDGKK